MSSTPSIKNGVRAYAVDDISLRVLPPKGPIKGMVLLLDGIPNPGERDVVMRHIAKKGSIVIYPQYKGTWKSSGRFLEESPAKEIDNLVVRIANHSLPFLPKNSKRKPIIIASSFGGSVVMNMRRIDLVKRIYCLSPVLQFKNVKDIASLESYLKKRYRSAFRFSHLQWNKLISDTLFKTRIEKIKSTRSKWTFLFGVHDPQIDPNELLAFAKLVSCRYVLLPLKHITIKTILQKNLDKMLDYS